MTEQFRKIIEIPEISRVEGHSAVIVNISNGKVESVQLDVFEGTRFFEKIVLGHKHYEIPHITSRVCAICSTGHVLAAIFAIEHILGVQQTKLVRLLRELMHLGMIIESHATHIFALALPDYVGAPDLVQFAQKHPNEFKSWTELRKLGSAIQTCLGGRPFHPVNLHPGGFSRYPSNEELSALLPALQAGLPLAINIAEVLRAFNPPFRRTSDPALVSLIPDQPQYGYFGNRVECSEGWEADIADYKFYLKESIVPYSHAKRASAKGTLMMVGSMARLRLFGNRLRGEAAHIYAKSELSNGDLNTIWNNFGQSVEMIEAIQRCAEIISEVTSNRFGDDDKTKPLIETHRAGSGVGAVECPRGTLYHAYSFDDAGSVTAADLVTPSVQNTARIECDIREVVDQAKNQEDAALQSNLETLVRAYDPCNTCATHMVEVKFKHKQKGDSKSSHGYQPEGG